MRHTIKKRTIRKEIMNGEKMKQPTRILNNSKTTSNYIKPPVVLVFILLFYFYLP